MTHVYLYPSDKFCGEFSLVRKFASPPAAIIGVHSSVGRAAARRDGYNGDKLALLWGEAQKKIAYSYLKMTLCYPNVNYSGLKVTYS